MYLETPLDQYKYMQMPLKLFLDVIIDHYNLREKALNGYVYMEIQCSMFGSPQAGILANVNVKHYLINYLVFMRV